MSDESPLIVKIDYAGLPDARETGRILDRLGAIAERRGNGEFARPPFRLVLETVEISSWISRLKPIFEIGVAVLTLAEQRQYLGALVDQLSVALEILRQSNGGSLASPIRNFFAELAAPIHKNRATRVEIYIDRTNQHRFVFEAADADFISQVVTGVRRKRLEQSIREELLVGPAHAHSRLPSQSASTPTIEDKWPLRPNEREAVLVHVGDGWKARISGGPEFLIPASGPTNDLDPHRQYIARGSVGGPGTPKNTFRVGATRPRRPEDYPSFGTELPVIDWAGATAGSQTITYPLGFVDGIETVLIVSRRMLDRLNGKRDNGTISLKRLAGRHARTILSAARKAWKNGDLVEVGKRGGGAKTRYVLSLNSSHF